MKINETQRINAIQSYKRTDDSKTQASKTRGIKKDEVQISTEGLELLQTQGTDRERIEGLKQSVASGTYHVESGKIAEKLWPYIK